MGESGRLRRSLFFVPGAEPRKLDKARSVGADTVIFDLEDSVAPDDKARARELVARTLREGGFGDTEPAVRVNAAGTPQFEEDVAASLAAGARALLIPKSERRDGLAEVARLVDELQADPDVRLLALVETPAGLLHGAALGDASPRLDALCFGHVDFCREMGIADADPAHGVVHHARCSLAIAARASGVSPIDTVCLAVRDEPAFRADTALGVQLGFDGKLCIHPLQVKIANELYTPTPQQIEYAQRVLEASERARAEGRGVFTVEGRMVDAPVLAAQQRVLERARRAGVLPAGRTGP